MLTKEEKENIFVLKEVQPAANKVEIKLLIQMVTYKR